MLKKILKNLSHYPRLRILLIVGAVLGAIVVVANVIAPAPKEDQQNRTPPSQVSTPRLKLSQERTVGVQEEATPDQVAPKKATFFEGLFDNKETATTAQPPVVTPSIKPVTPSQPPASASSASGYVPPVLPVGSKATNTYTSTQSGSTASGSGNNKYTSDQEQAMNRMAANIQNYVANSSKDWTLPTAVSVNAVQPKTASGSATGGAGSATGTVMIKAGSIMFAVLGTALNSDQINTPVMADIVSGPYKGAKLLGKFTLADDKLVIQFNMMSMPTWPSTVPISAYAINAETGENALASGVDNHYLSRYGSLFAASMLQGFGEAYSNATTSASTCTPQAGGVCNVTATQSNSVPTPSFSNAVYQGLGQVGTSLSTAVGQNFNRPPTVTVNQGTGIGILFMQDVQNPAFSTTASNTNS